jgi:AraC-like DNA-binding protein
VVQLAQVDNSQVIPGQVIGPGNPDLARLAELIKLYAPHDGSFELRIPGLWVFRLSRVYPELAHSVQHPSLCVIAQGAKTVTVGADKYEYNESRMIVYSVDLPVAAQVTRATPAEPYLGLKLVLDPNQIARLVLKVYPQGLPQLPENRAVNLSDSNQHVLAALVRLVELAAQPGEADLLAPLITDEILIRLLRGPVGAKVAQIGVADSSVNNISRAVTWLKAHYDQPVRMDELAQLANMSVSSFHQHFKTVTTISPLQFQKVLRLQEARRLMLSALMNASAASQQVGYASASQFSREYSRYFGAAPNKDITRLRELHALASTAAPEA